MSRVPTKEEKELLNSSLEFWGEKNQTLLDYYQKFASRFDQLCEISGYYLVHTRLINLLCSFVPEKDIVDKFIVDIACGTGPMGVQLSKIGCKNIHGLDFSKAMLEEYEKKDVYSKLFHVTLTVEPTPDIQENTYDVAVVSGGIFDGHLPVEALKEIARMVKPSGYIFTTLIFMSDKGDFMAALGALMKDGILSLERMESVPFMRDPGDDSKFINGFLLALKVL